MNNNGYKDRRDLQEDREIDYIFYPYPKKAPRRSSLPFFALPMSYQLSATTCEALLVISGLIGACFNAFGSIWGFIIWLPGNIGLAILNHKRGQKWQSALFAAYTLTAVWGIAAKLLEGR
jgi:hypothetical protein